MHSKAKALLYMSELRYKSGKYVEANVLLDNECLKIISSMVDEIRVVMSRFEEKHPCMKT
jgi:hypothetical protein